MLMHWSQLVPNMSTDIRGHEALHPHHHHILMPNIQGHEAPHHQHPHGEFLPRKLMYRSQLIVTDYACQISVNDLL